MVVTLVYIVKEKWSKKILARVLFIDIKEVFNNVSKTQLLKYMINFGIDGDLVEQTRFFLTNQKVQLAIDGYENKEKQIETRIFQGSPISPIFFLIFIDLVFDIVTEVCLLVILLSFVNNLEFITS